MASRFVSVTEEELLFFINEVALPDYTENATKFGNKVFKKIYFFYFLTINALTTCSKCFAYK